MAAHTKPANRNTINLMLDTTVFIAFLAATAPHFTGIAIHEWLSLALGAALITHLLLHWSWLVGVTRRLLGKLSWGTRLNYLLNALLFVAFTTVIFTGVMISEVALPLLGLQLEGDGVWSQLHRLASDATVILTGLHVAVHWRWVASSTRKLLGRAGHRRRSPSPELAIPTSKEVI